MAKSIETFMSQRAEMAKYQHEAELARIQSNERIALALAAPQHPVHMVPQGIPGMQNGIVQAGANMAPPPPVGLPQGWTAQLSRSLNRWFFKGPGAPTGTWTDPRPATPPLPDEPSTPPLPPAAPSPSRVPVLQLPAAPGVQMVQQAPMVQPSVARTVSCCQ